LYSQPNYFTHTQTGTVYGVQQSPVLDVFGRVDYGIHFFLTQNIGQVFAALRSSDVVIFSRQTQSVFIITLYGIDDRILFLLTYFIFLHQLKHIPFNLFLGECRQIAVFEIGEKSTQTRLICPDGGIAEMFQLHFLIMPVQLLLHLLCHYYLRQFRRSILSNNLYLFTKQFLYFLLMLQCIRKTPKLLMGLIIRSVQFLKSLTFVCQRIRNLKLNAFGIFL